MGRKYEEGLVEEHLADNMERGTLLCIFTHATETYTLRNFTRRPGKEWQRPEVAVFLHNL